MIEIAQRLVEFIERQAEPIRGSLYFPMVAGFTTDCWTMPDVMPGIATHVLSVEPGAVAFYRCVGIIGALDYHFSDPSIDGPGFWGIVPDSVLERDVRLKQLSLQEPLVARYRQQARAEWLALREGDLSPQALREYAAIHAKEWVSSILGL